MRKWITATLLVAALLCGALVLLRNPTPVATFTLPGGATLEVVKVTTGPTHRFRWDNRLRDVLGGRLPKALRDRLRLHIVELTPTADPSLILWIRTRRAGGTGFVPTVGWGSGRRTQVMQLGMADDHGVEVDVVPGVAFIGTAASSVWVFGWEFNTFPRHSREITVTLYSLNNNSRQRLGELQLPHPSLPAADTWRPEPLPVGKPLDDFTVSLAWAETTAAREESELNTSLGVELTRGGAPVTDWRLSQLELFTEEGPVPYRLRTQSTETRTGQTIAAISSGLWPDQPWRFRFWFERTSNYPTNELWQLEGIPGNVESNLVRQFGDWSVILYTEKAAPDDPENPLPNLWRTLNTGLNLAFAGPYDENWRLALLDARDDLGRKLTLVEQQDDLGRNLPRLDEHPAGRIFRTYKFGLFPNARSSSFSFAIHRAKAVDFVVKPQLREALEVTKLPAGPARETTNYTIWQALLGGRE